MALTSTHLQQFHELGYCVQENVFAKADFSGIETAIDQMIDGEIRAQIDAGLIKHDYANENFVTRLARIQEDSAEAANAICNSITGKGGGGFSGKAMLDVLRNENLVNCVQSIVGPDIVGSSVYRIRTKLPGHVRGEVPWHQDSGYMKTHCDKEMIVTCWVPLVDATLENGCLWVIPYQHDQGIIPHHTGGPGGFLIINEEDLPQHRDAVPVEIKCGSVLFMSNMLPHASFENRTRDVRWSLDLRYQGMQAPSNIDVEPEDNARLRPDVVPACYPPEADFVIRDTQNPEREIREAAAFHALRQKYERHPYGAVVREWPSYENAGT